MSVTLMDVANAAHVSIATVSRVLHHNGYVSAEVRELVEATIAELGYIPNQSARTLRNNKSYLIGSMVVPNPNGLYFRINDSIHKAAHEKGYECLTMEVSRTRKNEAEIIDTFIGLHVDGLVITSNPGIDRASLQRLRDAGVAVVAVERGYLSEGIDTLSVEDEQGVYAAVSHMAALGHRRVALICPKPEHDVERRRYEGYLRAVREYHLETDDELIRLTDGYAAEDGQAAAKALLNLSSPPTAVFCTADTLASGVMKEAAARSLRIPRHLSIAGYDDVLARELTPAINSVALDDTDIGKNVIELIEARIAAPLRPAEERMIRTIYVARGSVRKRDKGEKEVMKNEKLVRVGILGGGAISQRRHLPEYSANSNAVIAGIYDPNMSRAEELCETYGGKVYTSIDELINDPTVDAVSVCTPNNCHADCTIRALKAGKHVLCEKPMALNLAEAKQMLEAERTSGKMLMLGHNQRLIKAHLKAREILQEGMIGKPLFFQCNFKHSGPENWSVDGSRKDLWFFDKARANFGVMGDLGAHKIDLIRFLTNDEISEVFANELTLDKRNSDGDLIELDDNVVTEFKMVSGMPGIMHFSWTNYGNEDNSTVIYGDKGVMKIFGDYANDIVLEMRDGSTVRYDIGAIATNTNQTKSGVIDEFIEAIVEERKPIVTGIDGHNTIAVIEACEKSNREGRWVSVAY